MSDERIEGDVPIPVSLAAEAAVSPVDAAANDDSPLMPVPQPPRSATATSSYRVKLPVFEGPLDLLLHLIGEHQLDVLDIPVAFITEKYLEYLELMQVLNLDVAGEYLLMAATLALIKSRTLLPKEALADDAEDDEEADPRGALIRRLLEYQKYKQAAQELAVRPLLARDVFVRQPGAEDAPRDDAPLAEVSVFQLLEAFAQVMKRVGGRMSQHEVQMDRLSVSERINQLSEQLSTIERIEFAALFEGAVERHQLVVTFLALLEMTRLRLLRLFQDVVRGPIFITSTGVAAAGTLPADDAFEYRQRETPLPQPRALTDDEQQALRTLDSVGAESPEGEDGRRDEDAYDAFEDDDAPDDDDDDDDDLPTR